MISIRQGVFETNSSSMHAIVIPRNRDSDSEYTEQEVIADLGMDFSERRLILRATPSEKASYCFGLIVEYFNGKMLHAAYDNKFPDGKYRYHDLPEADAYHNAFVYAVFEKWLETFAHSMHEDYNASVKFINYRLDNAGGYIACMPNVYASLGCYGHKNFIDKVFSWAFRTIDHMVDASSIEEAEDIAKTDAFLLDDIETFIISDMSAIIQGSDEMDDDDIDRQGVLVMEYVQKNGGKCTVDWPHGG